MSHKKLKILFVDDGMNTGSTNSSKIGGGQIARRRFFSNQDLFQVTLLTSEREIARYWDGLALIIYDPAFGTYRPLRTNVSI